MGFSPWKAAEKKAKGAVNSVIDKILKPAIREGEKKAGGVMSGIERKGKQVISKVDDKIDDLTDAAIDRMKDAADGIEDGLTDKLPELVTERLPDLIEDAAKEMAELAAERSVKEALDKAIRIIEMTQPTRYWLVFGVELALVVQGEVTVTVVIPNPGAKLSRIKAWADHPPKGRAQIIECIGDFAPESLSGEFKVSGNGGGGEWDAEQKLEQVDAFLAELGVE